MPANLHDEGSVVEPESGDLSMDGGRSYELHHRDAHIHGLAGCENTVQRDDKEGNARARRNGTVLPNIGSFVETQAAERIDQTHSLVCKSQHQSRDDEPTLPYVVGAAHTALRPCFGIGEWAVDSLVKLLDGPQVLQSRQSPSYPRPP